MTGLLLKVREQLSLPRVQAIFGLIAAILSIGGALYGYLSPRRVVAPPPPTTGELVAFVEEARSGKPVPDATLELLTTQDAVVTTLPLSDGAARRPLKEGVYRLRVTHPQFVTEERQVQVMAGETAEIHLKLASRPVAAKPAPPKPPASAKAPAASKASSPPSSPANPVERAVNDGVEGIKKIFR